MIVIKSSQLLKRMKIGGIALCPFIIICEEQIKSRKIILNHEEIHIRQQLECLVFPFYLLYLYYYVTNLIKYGDKRKAYLKIPFEMEAYQNQLNPDYLKNRKLFSWIKYKSND
ncbi:MAG: hypothetical protein H0U27_07125 [Nitrosopumilus sp.]|nr:hypothetical protein [Nitrosopumilus sp.]